MNLDIYALIYICSGIFMTYTIYKFMRIFYSERNTNFKVELASYIGYFIIITGVHSIIKLPVVVMVSNLLVLFAITFNYRSGFKKRILTVMLIYIILICVEMLVVVATGYLKLGLLIKSEYRSLIGIIMIRIISYFVVLLIGSYKNIRNGDIISGVYWVCIFIIPAGTLYLLITNFMNSDLTSVTIFISTALVLLINFATFYMYDEISKILLEKADKVFIEQQNKSYEKQLELMQVSLSSTRTLKHDLKNHVASLYTLVERGKKSDLLDYLSVVADVTNGIGELSNTGNLVIDSIINFKLQDVEKENIDVGIDFNIPKDLDLSSFDITVILGNLIDNALNAVRKLEENRYINITMKYTKGRLILKMSNSFDGIVLKKDDILYTLNEDKTNHGLGLESVKSVLKKHDGIIEFEYKDQEFNVGILMYV